MNDLFDKFMHKELSDADQEELKKLLKNPEFMETAYLNIILKESLQEGNNLEFLNLLKEVEQIHYYQQAYTLEELLTYFTPIEEYEQNLSEVSRASHIQIIHPQNYINCVDSIHFEWKSSNILPLQLVIENNEYDVLIRKEIPSQTLFFDIELPSNKGFKPGRYYWKLASKRHQISTMGVFFIGKELNLTSAV